MQSMGGDKYAVAALQKKAKELEKNGPTDLSAQAKEETADVKGEEDDGDDAV